MSKSFQLFVREQKEFRLIVDAESFARALERFETLKSAGSEWHRSAELLDETVKVHSVELELTVPGGVR